MSPAERDALRAMVREAIREALAARGRASTEGLPTVERVQIASDADLATFVRRLATLLRDPASASRIEAGSHRFTLDEPGAAETSAPPALTGLVNERAVEAAAEGSVLRLGTGAVVTPLARDLARRRRIKLERVR